MSAARVRVRSAVAPLHADSRISSEQASQLLRGARAQVLEERNDWLRVRGEDGYEGWLHRGYAFAEGADVVSRATSLGCIVESAGVPISLPFGAHVFDGETVSSGEIVDVHEIAARFPADASSVVRSATRFFASAPYLWGGVTPWGADCSGFLQSVFRMHGVTLARDSSAQARAGTASASKPPGAAPGELLFFSDRDDGRITHVGIALGNGHMAHVALGRGGFAVEDFGARGSRDPYAGLLASRFRLARAVV